MRGIKKTWLDSIAPIGCLPMPVAIIFLISCLPEVRTIYNEIIDKDVTRLVFISLALLYVITFSLLLRIRYLKDDCESFLSKTEEEKKKFEDNIKSEYSEKEKKLRLSISIKETELSIREKKVRGFVNSLDKEKYCAQLFSDFNTVIYEEARHWLVHKRISAPTAAETIRKLKEETKNIIEEYAHYRYKEEQREHDAQRRIGHANARANMLRKNASYMKDLLVKKTPFKDVAELYADALALAYDSIAQDLRERVRPANARADEIVQELKQKIREVAYEAKQTRYRLDFLLKIFPDIKNYIYDDESLISMAEYEGLSDFNDNRDRARDYLSDEEYKRLSDEEKYQLSLDRYKERHKPNAWIAGAEYEMYCSYKLKEEGYSVVENGIIMRKADMGRDIIAHKDFDTYIIQCKRYSITNRDGSDRFIHENVICQLYGTTIEYKIANPDNTLFADYAHIIPVLYTTGQLSNMAEKFAKRLGVNVVRCEMGEYPMIKCNINNGERIYHLPFDQQYWNTKIEKQGEFYAWTVKEAEDAEFRRALRWNGNNN